MTTEKEYLQALESEKQALPRDLRLAVERSDVAEITRIKQRESTIDADIFSAKIQVIQSEIRDLEAKQAENYAELREAKANVSDYDTLVLPKAEMLRLEAQRISNESLNNLHRVKIAEQQCQHTNYLLGQSKDKLSKLLR